MTNTPVALVTGASRGLGRGIAIELAKRGFSIAINYAGNRDAAQETITLCTAAATTAQQKFHPIQADISSADHRARLLSDTLTYFGRLDALVNNAGIAPKVRADITEMSEDSWDTLLDTNLKGPFFLTQAVANHWLKNGTYTPLPGGPKIIFITSISANTASVNRGEYCVAKAGLAMSNQLWATRLAAHGIQVFEIRPGIMQTDMTSGVKEKYDALLATGLVPQMRWGQPQDIGLATAALLTGQLPFSTGNIIDVDGGFHLRRL